VSLKNPSHSIESESTSVVDLHQGPGAEEAVPLFNSRYLPPLTNF
jgi:hypothetical protein